MYKQKHPNSQMFFNRSPKEILCEELNKICNEVIKRICYSLDHFDYTNDQMQQIGGILISANMTLFCISKNLLNSEVTHEILAKKVNDIISNHYYDHPFYADIKLLLDPYLIDEFALEIPLTNK